MAVGIGAIVSAVLALALLIIGIIYQKNVFTKVVLFISSPVLLVFAAELAYLFLMLKEVKPNYFLFNSALNMNSSASSLTFEEINSRMNRYLSSFAPSEGKLWTDKILEAPTLRIAPEYRPIVAYKLLYDLADRDSDAGWKCFVLASAATVDYIAGGVAANGDTDLAEALKRLKGANPLNMRQVRDFLVGNKKYLKKRLYKYVVENINRF